MIAKKQGIGSQELQKIEEKLNANDWWRVTKQFIEITQSSVSSYNVDIDEAPNPGVNPRGAKDSSGFLMRLHSVCSIF